MAMVNSHPAPAGKKILVVDDSTFEQCVLNEILARSGYRVSCAYDGRQGCAMATATCPDLILLDVQMLHMDGYAACRLLKANPATEQIPVIFLSSENGPEACIRGLSLGAVDFIGKPFSTGELLARIEVHLHLMRRVDEGDEAAAILPAAASGDADAVMVAAAMRLIDDHLSKQLQLDDIAQQVGSYREKLSRVFLAQRGMTVFAHIREQRILRAAQLLRDTDVGIAEIALAVGVQNAGNFATSFRERMGVTPGAYRRSARAGGGNA